MQYNAQDIFIDYKLLYKPEYIQYRSIKLCDIIYYAVIKYSTLFMIMHITVIAKTKELHIQTLLLL